MEESWTEVIDVDGQVFNVTFLRRPFREGLQVQIEIDDQVVTLGELGFGLTEVRERVADEIRRIVAAGKT